MKKRILSVAVLFAFAMIFSSQASAQSAEVFGGYSYVRLNDHGSISNTNGGTGSLAFGVIPLVSAVADFGVYHGGTSSINGNLTSYMFGPKVSAPVGRIRPFAQVLFGGAHLSAAGSGSSYSAGENSFAMALGGGLDAAVLPHIGIRLIQAEYFQTNFNDGLNNRQNNTRISAGVTLRF
jgi:hypothetical protein